VAELIIKNTNEEYPDTGLTGELLSRTIASLMIISLFNCSNELAWEQVVNLRKPSITFGTFNKVLHRQIASLTSGNVSHDSNSTWTSVRDLEKVFRPADNELNKRVRLFQRGCLTLDENTLNFQVNEGEAAATCFYEKMDGVLF